jgi:4,5:9,10-diseco-3-hydroxy-5,9,17-trioxoandrosta-1(10),2-diene-4-oate hydrolase
MSEAIPLGTFTEVGHGWQLHHHTYGEGPPVLFLHGSGPGASGWSNFHDNAVAIAAHGYQAILPDSLGYGLSSKPTDVPYTMEHMAGASIALMERLGHPRYTVVGNSQGGAQAIWIALHHPDRVANLVLMAPGGLETRETYMELKGIRSMMRCLYGPEGLTLDGMVQLFGKQLFDASRLDPEVVRRRFEVAQTQPRHVFESMRVPNLEDRLHELSCPVLGLWGMQDVFCPPSGAVKLAERCPNARVTLINRCGHWVMVEHAAVFNRLLLDFLQNG